MLRPPSAAAATVLLLGTAVTPAARAQVAGPAARPLSYGLAVGAIIPTGSTGDLHNTGWHIQGLMTWMRPASSFGLRGDVAYSRLGGKTISVGSTSVRADDRTLLFFTGNIVWMRRPDAASSGSTPYFLAGVGLYRTRGSRTGTSTSGSERLDERSTEFGINLGAGLAYRFGSASLFIETRFHNVFNGTLNDRGNRTSAHYLPVSVGVRVGGGA
jgi:hypothetical protein